MARAATSLDHCVIHVSDWEKAVDFYTRVVGAEAVPAKGGGFVFRLGSQQLNVHGPDKKGEPLARVPVAPGNSDLCFRWDGPIVDAKRHLEAEGVADRAWPDRPLRREGRRQPASISAIPTARSWSSSATMDKTGRNRSLRRRGDPPRLSHPVAGGLRQAARLSRQRRVGAEAADGARYAIQHAYSNEYANVHRGLHFLSNAATDAYEKARETVRRFLNAGSVDEIVFTSNTTSAINTVAYGFGMPEYRRGRRDRHIDHGASFQHRAVAFHPRTAGRETGLGSRRRSRRAAHRGIREAPDQTGRSSSRSPICRTRLAP